MKQVLISKGSAKVAEVPAPRPESGEALVRLECSCLSIGTEMSGLRASALPMWRRAVQRPELIATTLKMAAAGGVRSTWRRIEERRDAARPTGYSAAGIVVEVGADVDDLAPGDRVACAGGGYAVHAEFVRVPRNLCAPLPEGLDWESASTVTLGAIALQGVRRAAPTLGETFVVIGLGILGQLTTQILKANGCRCIGVDLDRGRVDLAVRLGMDLGLSRDGEGDGPEQIARLTDGLGADGVIITAATPSDDVVSQAFAMCRKKGRVVLVGDVGLNLNRDDFYSKEIDFLVSTSYGPGRYDRGYEERGLDYPAAYVRWTENRNMTEYLRLLAAGPVRVGPLISARHAVDDAARAYASLDAPAPKPMMVLLTYPNAERTPSRSIRCAPNGVPTPGRIRVALIGAGAFARFAHLPNLKTLENRFALHSIVARNGHNAAAAAKQFGAAYASTDSDAVVADAEVDAVIIATRHHLHAELALKALAAGKHVLVEKPLALTDDELRAFDEFFASRDGAPCPLLMTAYNRRFSPYARRIAECLENRSGPFVMSYRMNAGYIPPDHWVHGPEGGGRNLGEACHIYDLFTFLSGSRIAHVSACSILPKSRYYARTDNFSATLRFADGSVASLTYTAMGSSDYPKETLDLHVDGRTLVLEDYQRLTVYGLENRSLKTPVRERGFMEELTAFADGINDGKWPIPWWQQRQVAETALRVNRLLLSSAGDVDSVPAPP